MVGQVRARFEQQLGQLDERVLQLGGMARQAVSGGMNALLQRDADLARQVIAGDTAINQLRFDTERQCYALIATEQPVAGDLRAIVAAIVLAIDIERIADHGKKIAKICLRMLEEPGPPPTDDIVRMYELALAMLDRSLRAFAARDIEEATATCRDDDQVDALYKQIFNALVRNMLQDPRSVANCTQLLQVAHELERVADRCTNIAERVIYSVSGQLTELNI